MVNLTLLPHHHVEESECDAWERNDSSSTPTTMPDSKTFRPLTDFTPENALLYQCEQMPLRSSNDDEFITPPSTMVGKTSPESRVAINNPTKRFFRHWKWCFNSVWLAIIPSFINFFVVDGIGYSLGLFFVAFTASFPFVSKSRVSAITSIHYSMTLISGPFASHVVDMYGCGRANMIGGFLAFAGFFCSSVLALNVYVLMVFLGLVSGLGVAIIYLASYTSIIVYFDTRKELATGIFSCGSGFGALLFGPLVSYLLNKYEWRGSLLILSAVFLQTIACGCLFILFDTLFFLHQGGKKAVLSHTETPSQKMIGIELIQKSQSNPYLGYHSLVNLNSHHGTSHSHVKQLEGTHKCYDSTNPSLPFEKSQRKSLSMSHLAPAANSETLKCCDDPAAPAAGAPASAAYQKGVMVRDKYCCEENPQRRKSSNYTNNNGLIYEFPREASRTNTFLRRSYSSFTHQIVKRAKFFRNFKFTTFFLSNLILYAGGDTPCLFTIDRASKLNVGSTGTLISIMGLSNTIGHVVYGLASQRISDKELGQGPREGQKRNGIIYLYCVSILICGGATVAFPFARDWASTVIFVFTLGFLLSSNYTLTSIITYNLTCPPQTETFPTAFGLILTAQGIGALIGAPIGGALIDFYGNYDIAFYLAGIFICLSGLMLIVEKSPIKCFFHDEWLPNKTNIYENKI